MGVRPPAAAPRTDVADSSTGEVFISAASEQVNTAIRLITGTVPGPTPASIVEKIYTIMGIRFVRFPAMFTILRASSSSVRFCCAMLNRNMTPSSVTNSLVGNPVITVPDLTPAIWARTSDRPKATNPMLIFRKNPISMAPIKNTSDNAA